MKNEKLKMSEIKLIVIENLVTLIGVDDSKIREDSNLKKDLGADSLNTVELLMEIEKELGFAIEYDDIYAIETVDDVVKYIAKYLKESNI